MDQWVDSLLFSSEGDISTFGCINNKCGHLTKRVSLVGGEPPPEWKVNTDGFRRLPRAPPSEPRSRPAGAPRCYARQRLFKKKFSAAARTRVHSPSAVRERLPSHESLIATLNNVSWVIDETRLPAEPCANWLEW